MTKPKQNRKPGAVRKDEILAVAIRLSAEQNYQLITRVSIAQELGISGQAIRHHFKDMRTLRQAMLDRAVSAGAANLVAQAVIMRDLSIDELPSDLAAEVRRAARL